MHNFRYTFIILLLSYFDALATVVVIVVMVVVAWCCYYGRFIEAVIIGFVSICCVFFSSSTLDWVNLVYDVVSSYHRINLLSYNEKYKFFLHLSNGRHSSSMDLAILYDLARNTLDNNFRIYLAT